MGFIQHVPLGPVSDQNWQAGVAAQTAQQAAAVATCCLELMLRPPNSVSASQCASEQLLGAGVTHCVGAQGNLSADRMPCSGLMTYGADSPPEPTPQIVGCCPIL